jgi:hypothetical protein
MAKRVRILLGWLMVAVLIGACMPSFLTYQAIPTPLPGAINLFVAQTAAVAATQTALLAPPTLTPSFTPTPTHTASPTLSPTPTFIFVLSTPTQPTATKKATSTATFRPGSGASFKITKTAKAVSRGAGGPRPTKAPAVWSCNLVSQSPAFGASYAPGTPFTTTWTVTNTGDRDWTSNSIDVVVVSGAVLAADAIYDTTCDTPVGNNCDVSVPMTAPSTSAAYTSNWTLRVGKTTFCPLTVTIIVGAPTPTP